MDKPPASLWVMAASVRIFGLSSWSILVPQALMGVATIGVLYATVRRRFSAQAGLLAAAVMALTPVATLMFRYNNPDALLILVMAVAGYCVLRSVEAARLRWLVLAGVLIGLGFLTKQLQVLLVVPGFALVYLIAAPTGLWPADPPSPAGRGRHGGGGRLVGGDRAAHPARTTGRTSAAPRTTASWG